MKTSFMAPMCRNWTHEWKFKKGIFGLCVRENASTFGIVIRGWVISKSGVFPIPGNVQMEAG